MTAVLTPTQADAAEFQAIMASLADEAVDTLSGEWRSWDWEAAQETTGAALAVFLDVASTFAEAAAGIAADWYDEWRSQAEQPGRFVATPAEVAAVEQLEASVRNAVNPLWQASPDAEACRVLLSGALTRHVMHGGNDTIVGASAADPTSVGWARIARAGACGFCRMLVGRGGVYRTEKSARFAAHDHCNCAVAPSWDPDAPEVDVMQYVASQRKKTAAERAALREYLAQYEG